MADWSPEELQAIVSDYMEMLDSELRGQKYRKAHHRRNLLPKLNNRSEGSIEFKHQNISAVLQEAGLQWIKGYKPASNYQNALKVVVLEVVAKQPFQIPPSQTELSQIPDGITQEHLLQAIKDFENDVEHRFGPSSTYDVLHAGKRYPPKAIVGLAARHILGSPLQPEDFEGGIGTKCFRVLTENGFTIVPKEGRGFSGAWIFQGNPKRFDIDEYLTEFDYVYWSVPQHKDNVQVGDTVYLWRAGSDAGIVAIGKVAEATTPVDRIKYPEVLANDLWARPAEDSHSVKVGIVLHEKRLTQEEAMIARESFLANPTLAGANIIRMPRPTVHKLTAEQAMAVAHLWATQNFNDAPGDDEEGHRRLRKHYYRERSGKLPARKKAEYLRTHANLACEVCGFQFPDKYPKELADGYIEVHHVVPLAELKENTRTKVEDLMLVCSNCHRMIHRTRDAESNLRKLVDHFTQQNDK